MKKRNRPSKDGARFIQKWMDACDAGLTVPEFCELHDINRNTVHGWCHRIRRRGILLPNLAKPGDVPTKLSAEPTLWDELEYRPDPQPDGEPAMAAASPAVETFVFCV